MQKRKMMFLMVLLLSLGFWWFNPVVVSAQAPADKYAPAPSTIKGWTPYAEPVKDWTAPDKRHPQYPWVLKDPFPWKPSWPTKDVPYTGEELLWLRECAFWGAEGGKTADYCGYSVMRNRRGFAQLVVKYNNAPGKWKDPDRYAWVPALRRVRRSAGGDRQDDSLGYPLSNDDNGERQYWEYTYEIIGEDVLYEVLAVKGQEIMGNPKVIADNPVYPGQGVWGDGMNPYREDGGVECWVVKVTPKDPKYYLGYLLYWIEKRTKLEMRGEQYDREGNF